MAGVTSFRGSFLRDCVEVVGEDQLEAAHRSMTLAELVAFGEDLLRRVDAYASEHGVQAVAERDAPDDAWPEGSPAWQAHIVYAAGRWCVFWGSRGHGLWAWF